jgi:hypothetical protein
MTGIVSPPPDLPGAGEDGFIHISDTIATELVEAGLSFEENDQVVVHAEHTTLKTSLDDLADLGVDSVEPLEEQDGDDIDDVIISLGFDFTGDEESLSQFEELLSSFDPESPIFGDDVNTALCITGMEAEELDPSIAEELGMLGFDDIIGDNDTVIGTGPDPQDEA